MFQSLPNPQPEITTNEARNPWAVLDLLVFAAFFFVAVLSLIVPLTGLPIIYAIPMQGVFDAVLVAFIAGWIRAVRRTSFRDFIRFFPNRTFSRRSLILLGAVSALSVVFVTAFLRSAGPTPLEKLLSSRSALIMYAVFGVTLAPLLEEIIFRGFLYRVFWEIGASRIATTVTAALFALTAAFFALLAGQLSRNWHIVIVIFLVTIVFREVLGPRVTIVTTAALFALIHAGQLAGNWRYVFVIFLVGCILSLVRYRSDSIIPSLIVHTSYNSMLVVLSVIGYIFQKIPK